MTLVIRPGRGWKGHRPGQHVVLGIELDGVREQRSFSLSAPPGLRGGTIAVTVKAAAGGRVSTHLVRRTAPGAIVELGQATGSFVLPEPVPRRLLFVTAGSGITPVMAMLRALATLRGRADSAIVHVDRTSRDVIFGHELRALARAGAVRMHEHHTARDGRPDPAALTALVPDWKTRETYACGPSALLDGLRAHFAAAGLAERLRVERFQLSPYRETAPGQGGAVTFARSGCSVRVDGATTLLAAGEAAGARLPYGCRMGICRGCVGVLRSGRVHDVRTGEVHDTPGDHVQTCVSVAAGPVELDL